MITLVITQCYKMSEKAAAGSRGEGGSSRREGGRGILCPPRAGPGLVGAAETSIRSSKEEQLQPGRIHVIRCKFKIKSKDPHLGSI